jgi:hypothetical protein
MYQFIKKIEGKLQKKYTFNKDELVKGINKDIFTFNINSYNQIVFYKDNSGNKITLKNNFEFYKK